MKHVENAGNASQRGFAGRHAMSGKMPSPQDGGEGSASGDVNSIHKMREACDNGKKSILFVQGGYSF